MKRCRVFPVLVLYAATILVQANCASERAPASAATATPALPTATKPSVPTSPMVLNYGLAQIPVGLDPHIYSASELNILLNNVYETLVYLSEDYGLEPSLAESWQVSDDQQTFTFKLHAGIIFHDGKRFNAQTVKENFDRIADPAIGSNTAATLLPGYQGTDVVDLYTVRVRFDRPNPDFLEALTLVYLSIASPEAFKRWGHEDFQMQLAGTGPFKFSPEEYIPGDTIVLEKNLDYNWGPAIYRQRGPRYFGSGHNPDTSCQQTHLVYDHTGPAYLDRVILKAIPDSHARAAALEENAADAVEGLSSADAARLQKEGKYWITAVPVLGTSVTKLNGARLNVNCLTYDAHGWSPFLYDVTLKPR